jgi:hypothetical protein
MMPKGSLLHPVEGDVSFIAYARFHAGKQSISPLIPGISSRVHILLFTP